MPTISRKPTSAGIRGSVDVVHPHLHKGKPCKSLTVKKSKNGGRNNQGRITVRHKGGGHKQKYRLIDFRRNKDDVDAKVERIEYDPNRTAHIALLVYSDGERRYILAPKGLKAGDKILSGNKVEAKVGNSMPLQNIPVGQMVHCVEMRPGKGGQLVRSAGTSAQLVAVENDVAKLRMPSKEVRVINAACRATIGELSNKENNLKKLGKAGKARWKGIRPTVRGVAMNPVDHPHGGGEGRTSGGKHPVTPWGIATKGKKTRNNKRTDKNILSRRKK